jgi:GNAT superfamily N-acetyltransferase
MRPATDRTGVGAGAGAPPGSVSRPADPRIRDARPADVPEVVALVHELAAYERLSEQCHLTADLLHAALFGPHPSVFCQVALREPAADAPVVGFALWFLSFSTWEGVCGIYLEDLFVRPDQRGRGLGRALLSNLAAIAVERGYARVEWSVLDWNTPSIEFYRALGAVPMAGWTMYRLSGPALARRAAEID